MHKTHQEHLQSELSMKGENMFFFFCYLKAITWINSVSIWNRNKHITSVSISQSEKYDLCTKRLTPVSSLTSLTAPENISSDCQTIWNINKQFWNTLIKYQNIQKNTESTSRMKPVGIFQSPKSDEAQYFSCTTSICSHGIYQLTN